MNASVPVADSMDIYSYVALLQHHRPVLYGAGGVGGITAAQLIEHGIQPVQFIDDNPSKAGTLMHGIPVSQFDEYKKNMHPDDIVIVTCSFPVDPVRKLTESGISYITQSFYHTVLGFHDRDVLTRSRSRVDAAAELFGDQQSLQVFQAILDCRYGKATQFLSHIKDENQYFDMDLIHFEEEEIFVDGGAFDGETSLSFSRFTNGRYREMHLFEPDPENMQKTRKRLQESHSADKRVFYIEKALSDQIQTLHFVKNSSSSSFVSEEGTTVIEAIDLDSCFLEHVPTFIKLDVEGHEAQALEGMRRILSESHPKLAISIYHKAEDLWEIPLLIHEIQPGYRLFLRHYSDNLFETVCYAVWNGGIYVQG